MFYCLCQVLLARTDEAAATDAAATALRQAGICDDCSQLSECRYNLLKYVEFVFAFTCIKNVSVKATASQ